MKPTLVLFLAMEVPHHYDHVQAAKDAEMQMRKRL
jgi:hypothetical protein